MEMVIVSRHPATIEWLKGKMKDLGGTATPKVITGNVTASDVRGKNVVGNLPMYLAEKCNRYWAVELPPYCPRGQELDIAYLINNARTREYLVQATYECCRHGGATVAVERDEEGPLGCPLCDVEQKLSRIKSLPGFEAWIATAKAEKDASISAAFAEYRNEM